MNKVHLNLENWKTGLLEEIDVSSLFSRNPTAHKWKAPFRSMLLRESISWRCHDLLSQSVLLYEGGHLLGTQVLFRSYLEAFSVLVYRNLQTEKVIAQELDFHEFSDKTSQLLLGSRNGETQLQSINILTILRKCESQYPGLSKLYASLSECAHPNYQGLMAGYSRSEPEDFKTNFYNRWDELISENYLDLIDHSCEVFLHEYNTVWPKHFEALELWIAKYDGQLEATKADA